MTPEELKAKLVSHGSTPEGHASVTIRGLAELPYHRTMAEKTTLLRALLNERFEVAQAETLAGVSYVLDEIAARWRYLHKNERMLGMREVEELQRLAKALRGGEAARPDGPGEW